MSLSSFTWYKVFEIHPCIITSFLFFNDWIIFHCVAIPHFVYPFICRWTFRLFSPFLWIVLLWTFMIKFCLSPNFQFFWVIYQEVKILGNMWILCLTFFSFADYEGHFLYRLFRNEKKAKKAQIKTIYNSITQKYQAN